MARFKFDLHSHEEDPDGPQPRYTPYPTRKSSVTGMWTDYGEDEAYEDTGVWKDWSKVEHK
jgi:hypothetical protein